MAQDRIKIRSTTADAWADIVQPVEFEPNWETTYTEDSGRVRSGSAHLFPMFTVHSFSAKWADLKPAEVARILSIIVPTETRPNFQMHFFNWIANRWEDGTFYVGQGSMNVQTLKANAEEMKELSCNIIGVERIK